MKKERELEKVRVLKWFWYWEDNGKFHTCKKGSVILVSSEVKEDLLKSKYIEELKQKLKEKDK